MRLSGRHSCRQLFSALPAIFFGFRLFTLRPLDIIASLDFRFRRHTTHIRRIDFQADDADH